MADDTNARSVRERAYSISEDALSMFDGEPEALHLWLYAMTCDEHWVFRKACLITKLGITPYKWRGAVKFLKSIGLLEVKTIKNCKGKFFGKSMIFYSIRERDNKRSREHAESIGKKSSGPHRIHWRPKSRK